jgi:hypothetical protein
MRKALLTLTTLLVLGTPTLSQSDAPECDFSSYKPLFISHVLLNSVVKRVEPKYPGTAMTVNRSEAKVQVKIVVDRDGNVVEACAIDGHPLLREPARRAALEWKFKRNFGLSKRPKAKYVQSAIIFTFRFNKN